MPEEESITIRATEESKQILKRLEDEGYFNQMLDGYRFAIAFAIAKGKLAPEGLPKMSTYINIGTLDKDGILRSLIHEIYPDSINKVFSYIERLAEAGIKEMGRLLDNDELRFGEICDDICLAPNGISNV
jgi:hypothetical protein